MDIETRLRMLESRYRAALSAAVAAKVEDLERVSIGVLRMGTLAEGQARELSVGEVRRLRKSVGLS